MNWLVIAAVYLGLKQRWVAVFVLGLTADTIGGGRLGIRSLIFLTAASAAYGVKYLWPLRSNRQIKLKW